MARPKKVVEEVVITPEAAATDASMEVVTPEVVTGSLVGSIHAGKVVIAVEEVSINGKFKTLLTLEDNAKVLL